MKKNKPEATLRAFLFSMVYYAFCFFIFILFVNNVVIELITNGKIGITKNELVNTLVASGIVGVTAGCRVWIFAKIDERKARKSPPTDPKF
ncbi:hypothetical protein RF656_21535 [Yersinia kristensenii]|uniref:hypothetical protein n=1 Tax=Yersinia kristensenii TaxID=28152 RepID=UPI00285344EC|nr:hypothetical protein [Yersinia kristensenii]MDR4899300.1 hypothetical protein [Yersinia kristensenii]